jgi:hypothetical protein
VSEPRELPCVATPCSPGELAPALVEAWRSTTGDEPSRGSILLLLAQWALETGWGRYCYCWNLGNYRAVRGECWTYLPRCSEVVGGVERFYRRDVPAEREMCRFAAWESLDDAARFWLGKLRSRFARAWPAVLSGSPAEYGRQLKAAGYYTADEAHYTGLLVSIVGTLDRRLPPVLAAPPEWTAEDEAAVARECPFQGPQSVGVCVEPPEPPEAA